MAQRRDRAAEMRLDGPRRDTEHFRGALGIEIKEQAQGNDLALAGGEPQQRGHDLRFDGRIGAVRWSQVRD